MPLGATVRPEEPADWAEEEFGRVLLYDGRLKARLFVLARDFYGQPTALLPQACDGSEAKAQRLCPDTPTFASACERLAWHARRWAGSGAARAMASRAQPRCGAACNA